MDIPKINKRILQLIDYYSNRSVKKFAESINMPQQTVNRLFNIDSRTKKYPVATTELLISITEMYVDVGANWLLTGRGEMLTQAATKEPTPTSSGLDERLLAIIKEKDIEIKEQAKEIGRLEERINFLNQNDVDSTDAEDAVCVAAAG